MKKIQLALIAIVVVLSACSKEQSNSTYQDISVSELSSNIVNYVDENYPDANIVSAVQANSNVEANYVLTLSTAEEIAFDASGNCLGNAEDFGAASHQRKGRGPRGGGHGHGGGHGGGHGNPGGIPVDSLPTVITSYIATNYDSSTVVGARMDTTCQFGNVISVMIRKGRTAPTKLSFDLTGAFLFKSERALYTSLPQAVTDTIAAHYTTAANVRTKAEKLTLASSVIEYNVYLRVSGVRTAVTLLDNGTIVCTR